ncbi:peptide ABC transporter substrate-binding protein [Oceanivirga miroungae]|uniref:Family 5 extracellular solute-binding protein n=1 Tax=Oceanivirga miroungae TaxID=1130046 RepID=A0A6I8M8I7_9FUSO|nr:peptide ABC transporter substrate-binding protein [Oceanivirga miroungae]VWL85791.1 family 5 extracellular solute-binding protein [Oceanivirga miroungae]
MKNNIKKIIFLLFITLFMFLLVAYFKKPITKEVDTTITYNIYTKPSTIDPHQFRDMLSVELMNEVYEGLLREDKDGNFIPALSSSYSISDDKLTYTFKIRKDAKYSDGSSVTADDVVNGFIRALDPHTAARYAEMLFPIVNAEEYNAGKVSAKEVGVKKIDENTVVLKLNRFVPYFNYILTLPISYPIADKFKDDIADINTALYNGPYLIKKMNDDEIILEKNKFYWNSNNVEIKNVKFAVVKNYAVVENLIKNDELDLTRLEPFDFETKRKNKELMTYQNGRAWFIGFNMENEILNKVENRLAISHAIDRNKYVKDVKDDGSVASKSIISTLLGDYRKNYPDKDFFEDNIKSDILKGKKLRLLTGNTTSEVKEANFLQEELRVKLGLIVEVLTVNYSDRLALTRLGNYDMVLDTYGPKFNDPLTMLYRFNRNKPHFNAWNKEKYSDLIKQIEVETNKEKRQKLINEAEHILIDEAVIVPLYYSTENWFIRNKYKNIIVHPISNTMDIHEIKVK